MKAGQCMTRNVRITDPGDTIQDAARMMIDIDAGFLPVGENDRLVGMITDRDIAVRAVAGGMGPDTRVGDVMTRDVKYCFEDDDIDDVAEKMAEQQVRRIPVLNRDKRLVGVLSLGDLATNGEREEAAEALSGIARPGALHNQKGDSQARPSA